MLICYYWIVLVVSGGWAMVIFNKFWSEPMVFQNVAWFDEQWSQYVLFHKQPVEVGEVLGGGQALSYLKLRGGFFV